MSERATQPARVIAARPRFRTPPPASRKLTHVIPNQVLGSAFQNSKTISRAHCLTPCWRLGNVLSWAKITWTRSRLYADVVIANGVVSG